MKLEQKDCKSFRTFAARVKGKAETCGFQMNVNCSCGKMIHADYTTETIRDVLLAGIADLDIRREALSTDGVLQKPINDLIAFVERREMSKNAAPGSTLSAISTFKRQKQTARDIGLSSDARKEVRNCPGCRKSYRLYRRGRNGWNNKPYSLCFNCFQQSKLSQNCLMSRLEDEEDEASHASYGKPEVRPFVLNNAIF